MANSNGKQVLTLKQKTKIMKKYLFMAVAGMLALSSCSNDSDELVINETPHKMTFTAGYADGDVTRAAIHADKSVTWEADDNISILSAKNANAKFTTSAGGATADFTGEAVDDSKFYAVYPYGSYTLDGTTIKGIQIGCQQKNDAIFRDLNASENWGWDKNSAIAVAEAGPGEALSFKNICAVLKVRIVPSSMMDMLTNGTVKVQATENMCGTFDYDTTTGTISNISDGNNYVQVNPILGLAANNVYISIIPGTYSNFKLTVSDDMCTSITKTKSSVTFEAGKVYDLGSHKPNI